MHLFHHGIILLFPSKIYEMTIFQFSDQQESTSNTSRKRKRFSANEEAQDLVEIERQRLEVQNNNEYKCFTSKILKQSLIITYSLFTFNR